MHRATFPIRSLVVVTGLALAGCGSGENKEATAPPTPTVGVAEVVSRDITPSTTFNGRVVAVDKVELRARIAGFLEKRNFTEGRRSTADSLSVLDREAAVPRPAVQQAQAAVAAGAGRADRCRAPAQRAARSWCATGTSRSPRSMPGRAERDNAQGQLLPKPRRSCAQAQINLGYTDITAPIAGRDRREAPSPSGNFVGPVERHARHHRQPGPDLCHLPGERARAAPGRKDAEAGARIEQGQVKLGLPDGSLYDSAGHHRLRRQPGRPDHGHGDGARHLPNPKRDLIDGQIVGVVVESAEPQPPLVVPQAALLVDQAGPYVLIVDGDGQGRAAADQARGRNRAPTWWSPRA